MEPMATIALRAARDAAQHIARAYDRPDLVRISEKGHNDFVTNIDREAEEIIVAELRKTYRDHSILGEEGTADLRIDGAEYEWIIDPIDGTANFVRQFPHFCVAIACTRRGKLEHGIIIDPIRNEEFVASRGKGCSLNGRAVRVSKVESMDGALIATGGRYRDEQEQAGQVAQLAAVMSAGAITRQPGSACLEMAYLASGRIDGLWMRNLSPWDIAAGALMIGESGGLLGDFDGGAKFIDSGNVVAAAPRVFKQLAPLVKRSFG